MKKFISQVFIYLLLGIGMAIIGLLLVPTGALVMPSPANILTADALPPGSAVVFSLEIYYTVLKCTAQN